MDIRQLIASNVDLLASSLAHPSTEFMYYLLEKQLISHVEVKKHREIGITIPQVEHLVRLICRRADTDLANEFVKWLDITEQFELRDKIVGTAAPTAKGDDVKPSQVLTFEEDDGESECESLSPDTTSVLDIVGTRPLPDYVEQVMSDTENVYPISSPTRGIAMIVVNEKSASFQRAGSEYDRKNLNKLFTWLGYQVLQFDNMTSTDLTKKLHDLARNPEQHCHGSFVLCLLTGGNSETVVMADNSKLNTDEILDRLDSNNFPAMAGKPKFVFFDVDSPNSMMDTGIRVPKDTHEELWDRRTGDLKPIQVRSRNSTSLQDIVRQRDTSAPIVTDYISSVARKADFVIFLASFPQYKALHNCHMGSIATRVLVEVFYKHSHSHHVVLLGQKIRRKLGSKTLQKMKQVLTTIDTLSKDFYLFPPTS